jgi:shikimate dehydrogenase
VPFTPIDGNTQLVGLVGWPVEHTLSPAMHNAAFQARGLNWRYVPLPVRPGHVEAALRGLVALGFRGANVTVPHKQTVLPALDAVAPDAATLGAVNTVVVEWEEDRDAILSGHNTDALGFIGALRDGGFDPAGSSVLVVGAGGAARAVVFGLVEAGAANVVVLNRTSDRARALTSDLGQHSPATMSAEPLRDDILLESARTADLLVNATPVGMWPGVDASIWPDEVPLPPDLTVFDLVYNPLETKLLRRARRSGAHAVEGLGMLVRQGALTFELWTGEKAPMEVMRVACERGLKHQAPG